MRRTTVFSGFLAAVLLTLSGCGSSASSSGAADGAQQGGGQTSASIATGQGGSQGTSTGTAGSGPGGSTSSIASSGAGGGGAGTGGTLASTASFDAGIATNPDAFLPGVDAPLLGPDARLVNGDARDAMASCPGPNPAVGCRSFADACVPSACSCVAKPEGLVWECTADCRTSLPLCPDAGSAADTGMAPDAKLASNCGKGSGVFPCGNTLCTTEQSCCNVNCGTCTPRGADCAYEVCAPPASWACACDDDCIAVDDYCGGCNCTLMGRKGDLGTCTKGLVNCFVAPCANLLARCQNGVCALGSKTIH